MKNTKINEIPNRWFYFSIILSGLYFLIRIIDQSKMMWIFPLDYANDHVAHIAKLFFLDNFGFGQLISYWWNGFYLLKFYHPASFYYELPFYYLFNDYQIALFISIILTFILIFFIIWFLGKNEKLSKIKRVAFYFFIVANPLSLSYFLRTGKYSEFLSFFLMICLFTIVIWYKNHKLNYLFLFFIPIYSLLSITHISMFFVSSFLILSLFLIKDIKEKTIIILSSIISVVLTSWWWFPFLINSSGKLAGNFYGLQRSLLYSVAETKNDIIVSFIVPVLFFIIFYIYWISINKSRREFLFYSVPLIVGFLIFTRLAAFIPYMNRPIVDTYYFYFILLGVYLVFKINFNNLGKKIKRIIFYSLIIIPIIMVLLSILITPFFIEHTIQNENTIKLFPYVDNKLYIYGSDSYSKAYYAYAVIFYNISSPSGWGGNEGISEVYLEKVSKISESLREKNCEKLKNSMGGVGTTNLISYNEYCWFLEGCGLDLIKKEDDSCLYKIKDKS